MGEDVAAVRAAQHGGDDRVVAAAHHHVDAGVVEGELDVAETWLTDVLGAVAVDVEPHAVADCAPRG